MINKPRGSRQKVDLKGMRVDMVDDTQDYRYATVSGNGITQRCQLFTPYGLCANPPDKSLGITFNIQGIASNKIVLVDDPKNRKKNLSKGEVALVDYLTGNMVYLRENGQIDIETASGSKIELLSDGTIKLTGNTTIEGNLQVNGSITATGNVECADIKTSTIASLNAHVHSGVTTGPSNTGPATG